MALAQKAPLDELAFRYRRRVARVEQNLATALVFAGIVAGALLGRGGTLPTRLGGALIMGGGLALFVYAFLRTRATLSSTRKLLERTLLRAEPAAGQKALRALSLIEARRHGAGSMNGESEDLAALHFERVLARSSPDELERWTRRLGDRLRLATLTVVVAAGTALAFDPGRVLEGLDVLFAYRGRAPWAMTWISSLRVLSQPPAYLRSPERLLMPVGVSYEAAGSVITFQGVPDREGRKLLLIGTNGKEVPFVSDGAGGMVARWVLGADVALTVAARFGRVLITEPEGLELRAVTDEPPIVVLEDAPRTIALEELPTLELRYEAADDYGLREIALVLESGAKQDRRTLERLDGEARQRSGAQALSPSDPFLRRAFLPVHLSVEARDNDGFSGAKWGKSAVITLLPPGIGKAEAARLAAFRAARDALLDALSPLAIEAEPDKTGAKPKSKPPSAEEQKRAITVALAPLRAVAEGNAAWPAPPRALRSFLLGQARSLERPAPTRETLLRRLEDVVLAVDAALGATGNHDAEAVAKRLGDVAEEVAEASKLGGEAEQRASADRRISAALLVLDAGVTSLSRLGTLGADVGSVAAGETRRIRRALAEPSYLSAELAARHLAARLRRPKPSFSSAGGGGVESGGGGRKGPSEPGEASQAHRQFEELMRELSQLSAEHAGEISAVESALENAEQQSEDAELKKEARERADALRRALEALPDYATDQPAAERASALSREHGRAMAESVARLSLKDAAESGKSARAELEAARQAPSGSASQEALGRASAEIERQLAWVGELLEQARKRAAERAKEALERSGQREQEFAERAENLAGRGSHGEAALPKEVAEGLDRAEGLMREAARELRSGRGDRGLELQKEAQRLLEQQDDDEPRSGDQGDQGKPEPSEGESDGKEGQLRMDAKVPGKDPGRRAEEFRRRVLEGLSRDKGGRLGPAVKRYAEGLLK